MSSSGRAISVRSISKVYSLDRSIQNHTTLAESLMHRMRTSLQRRAPSLRREQFWALKDISFEVQKGEVIGIIGRNGAGKSTLLKILSRITEPTSGAIDLYGTVGSLLEVGTGFHQELTGRENIYLNGAILGMVRSTIKNQFDAIVDFAGVGQFLDTPVKRYSSGMYVRLAFAVAAHLNPDILIVDEVLAVGDREFQSKCMGKMKQVAKDGRTVLFVSHNMAAVHELCTRAILLHGGSVDADGDVPSIVRRYSERPSRGAGSFDLSHHSARGGRSIIHGVTLRDAKGRESTQFHSSESITFEIHLESDTAIDDPRIAVAVEDVDGRRLFTVASYMSQATIQPIGAKATVCCEVDEIALGPGRYLVSLSIANRKGSGLLDSVDGAVSFDVEWDDYYHTAESFDPAYGPSLRRSKWRSIGRPPSELATTIAQQQ